MNPIKPKPERAIARLKIKQNRIKKKISLLSWSRIFVFASGVILFSLSLMYFPDILFIWKTIMLIFFLLLFIILAFTSQIFKKSLRIVQNLICFQQSSLERINDTWQNSVDTSNSESPDTMHPYALDLGITGKFSLLGFVNRCNTRFGSNKLKSLLLNQPDKEALDQQKWDLRKSAIEELSEKYVLRNRWVRESVSLNDGLNETLTEWSRNLKNLELPGTRLLYVLLLPVLGILSSITLISYPMAQMELMGAWYLLSLPVQFLVFLIVAWRANQVSTAMSRLSFELGHLHKQFQKISRIKLSSFYWNDYEIFDKKTGRAIICLTRLGGFFELRKNPIVYGFFGILFFHEVILLFGLQLWLNKHKNDLEKWLNEIGTLDALVSISLIVDVNPQTTFPRFSKNVKAPMIRTQNCRHPLLGIQGNIGNDVELNAGTWILTGSNMSGKSTFLRTLGLNYLLSLIGGPVFADSFEFYPGGLITSMQHIDSLKDSYSLFYTEVQRLRQIQDFIQIDRGLVLIDEMLRGTNSRERQIAQEGFLKNIELSESLIVVATHDIELAKTNNPKRISKHFRENIINDQMSFDYKLHDGPVETSNALKILKQEGIKL